MTNNKDVVALDLPIPDLEDLPADVKKYFDICIKSWVWFRMCSLCSART